MRLKWLQLVITPNRSKIQLPRKELLLIQRRTRTRFRLHRKQERCATTLPLECQQIEFYGLCMSFCFYPKYYPVAFFRKRFLWSIPNQTIAVVAFLLFIGVTMTIGILIVCFRAPKAQGMFFKHSILRRLKVAHTVSKHKHNSYDYFINFDRSTWEKHDYERTRVKIIQDNKC